MKKYALSLAIFIALLSLSCSSDDSNSSTNLGVLTVNGQSFPLTKGFIIPNYTGNNPSYNPRRFYFILTNDEVSLINNQYIYGNGIKQLINFNMYVSSTHAGSVENTTYPIYDTSDPNFSWDNAYIDHSGINTNVVIQNNNYVSSTSLSSDDLDGHATISKNDTTYTITFSFSNAQNTVFGNYTGPLTDLNYLY